MKENDSFIDSTFGYDHEMYYVYTVSIFRQLDSSELALFLVSFEVLITFLTLIPRSGVLESLQLCDTQLQRRVCHRQLKLGPGYHACTSLTDR
jgi:hypothetical protein